MPHHESLHVPHGQLPAYLRGLEPPVSVAEALAYAEARGAPPEALEFIESLPGAVFTSEEGLRHAFSTLQHGELPEADPEEVAVARDGISG